MTSVADVCFIHTCTKPKTGRHFCEEHYLVYKPYGAQINPVPHKCFIDDCKRKYYCLGYCQVHGARIRKGGNPLTRVLSGETHGMTGTPEHKTWLSMINRCYNSAPRTQYKPYHGKGITVCDAWRNDFMNFYKDMGKRPKGMTIDRIDSDGNYEPSNCRWATMQHQAVNKKLTIRNTTGYKGVRYRKKQNTWEAKITVDGVYNHLGTFKDPISAAKAYNKAALEAWGEYAYINPL